MSTTLLIDILTSTIDITDCLSNCSQNGICKYLQIYDKFSCNCDSFFSGTTCSSDTRPCSKNPCLNNGTCVQNLTDPTQTSYYCECGVYYKGKKCESKINVCENETCSGHGSCVDENNEPKCKCFNSFYGKQCETMSEGLVRIKAVTSFATITAIIIICLFYLMFIAMDLTRIYLIEKRYKRHNKKKRNNLKYAKVRVRFSI